MRPSSTYRDGRSKGGIAAIAAGVLVGLAAGRVLGSLARDIVLPLLGALLGYSDLTRLDIPFGACGGSIRCGVFLAQLFEGLLAAVVAVFVWRRLSRRAPPPPPPVPPPTRECPFCCSRIPAKATRCPHCTSEIKRFLQRTGS